MNDKKLLEVLMETELIKFAWDKIYESDFTFWNAKYLQETEERIDEFRYIKRLEKQDYDLEKGVYCYKEIDGDFKLIAIIYEDEIKEINRTGIQRKRY